MDPVLQMRGITKRFPGVLALDDVDFDLRKGEVHADPETRVDELGVAMQQMVEVAKALSMEAEIIVWDEPTASLGENEIAELLATIRQLKEKGVSVIYISHRLQELPSIADRVTVLRDGKKIATRVVGETDFNELIRLMVGRTLSEQFPKVEAPVGPEVLRVEGLTWGKKLKDISFSLYRGEVLGFAGLVGSGRTELMRCIFGAQDYDKDKIYLEGAEVKFRSPRDAVRAGIGFITEDRKKQGLFLGLSVTENITITDLDRVIGGVFIDRT